MKKILHKPTKKPLKKTQLAMIEAMKAQLGNVTASVGEVGIHRDTHYDWMRTSPEYKKAIESVDDLVLDFAENSLHRQIANHNTQATLFYLKTKGKARGFVEKKEIEITGTLSNDMPTQELEETIKRLLKS